MIPLPLPPALQTIQRRDSPEFEIKGFISLAEIFRPRMERKPVILARLWIVLAGNHQFQRSITETNETITKHNSRFVFRRRKVAI